MVLKSPFSIGSIVQKFGANAVSAYAGMNLIGHPGIDYGVPYGTDIPAAVDAYCYSLLNKDNPDLQAYRAVCTLVDDGNYAYEIIYGHCSDIYAKVGQTVSIGQIIAKVGNTGDVYEGGRLITPEEKKAGSKEGSHLHFQVRWLRKVPESGWKESGQYINDGQQMLTLNGFIYERVEPNNGYNGCIDPMQFFVTKGAFNKNLAMGMNNADVLNLQKRLGVIPQTGFFGSKTLRAVIEYQKAHGITPTGFVGTLTRASLNQT